ncbi:MAG: YciI family protein [Rhizobiaceae bacterium]|nr:YciI family protein [Rhizobiaceae bacterium]MCV0405444.1 YciI family protein [Rhizobiaceae bacterium]
MRYAFLCYDNETVVGAWTKEQDAAVMEKHFATQRPLEADGRLKASLRLMPTTAATTVRPGEESLVVDGPFAETKEQLLGFWLADCETYDDALEFARKLANVKSHGAIEIRPVHYEHEIGQTG